MRLGLGTTVFGVALLVATSTLYVETASMAEQNTASPLVSIKGIAAIWPLAYVPLKANSHR